MNKIDWTFLTALISVAFGWSLNEFGQWFRTRKEDKKIKKQVLYNLLEINYLINLFDTSELINLITERILLHFPKQEQTIENKNYLKKLYSGFVRNLFQDEVEDKLKALGEKYSRVVDILATIDPITAYRLNGKTNIIQTIKLTQDYFEEVKKQFPNVADQNLYLSIFNIELLEAGIIKEAIKDLEDEIRNIAYSINIKMWCKTKQTLKRSKERMRKNGIREIDELIDKLKVNNL